MRIGTPPSSANCFDRVESDALAAPADILVPNPAAGMMTMTFIDFRALKPRARARTLGPIQSRLVLKTKSHTEQKYSSYMTCALLADSAQHGPIVVPLGHDRGGQRLHPAAPANAAGRPHRCGRLRRR